MENSTQTVDELIMALMQMGFELEDCQQAIENGKLSANEVVEWILAGKPQKHSSQPVLKLSQPVESSASNLKVEEVPSRPENSLKLSHAALGLERTPAEGEEEIPIVSRLSQNEEQKLAKMRYEEKQRQEARKQLQAERLAKQKALEETRRRIQEDRENLKVRTTPAGSQQSPDGAGSASAARPLANQLPKPQRDDNTCLLMIRLTDGSSIRQSFPADSPLWSVRDFVCKHCSIMEGITLIQPFPHIEFGESDLSHSLRDLGLVPNGSLVVKKSEPVSAQPPGEADKRQADTTAVTEPSRKKKSPNFEPPSALDVHSGKGHNWGDGQRLMAEKEPEEEPMEDEDDLELLADSPPPPPQFPAHLPPVPPAVPHFPNFPGHPMFVGNDDDWNMNQVHHNWGLGNMLSGEVLENVTLPHHKKDPKDLAAEAARRRYGSLPVANQPPASSSLAEIPPAPLSKVPALCDILLRYVTSQLSDPRSPIFGLQGIPENLASQMLDYLIKDNVLKPATLQMFISCRLQKVNFDSYKYCTNALLSGLRHHSQLKQISLKSCSLITEKGLQFLTGLKSLRVLNLADCHQINDTSIPVFAAVTSLVCLNLEGTSVTDAGIKEYMSFAPPNLRTLDLSRTKVTEAIFIHLANAPALVSLNMEQTQISGLSGIQRLTKLVNLNISNTRIVTDAMLCLPNLQSLASLKCSNTTNVNGDVAVSYLAHLPLQEFHLPNRLTTTDEAIRHITGMKLTELDLTNYIYVTDASLPYIGQLTQLRILRLSNTKISDGGMEHLLGLAKLEELNLDRTAVSNTGTSIIRGFSQLRELSLSSTSITNGFLRRGVLNACTELIKLNLSRNTISDQGITCLRLPKLTLLNVDETYIRPTTIDELRSSCPYLEKFTYRTLNAPPKDESDFD